MNIKNLAKFFSPKGVAIYGVSRDSSKIGSTIFSNLLSANFPGKVYPINPKYKEIYGYKCYKKASEIPHRVDLAIMAIPAEFVVGVLKDCYKKGIKNLIIISAGFSEVGGEGIVLQKKVTELAETYGINIIGPNTLGVIVPANKLNSSFAATMPLSGEIALMSQSGAVCTAILDMANERNIGFSHLISLGNKPVINENHVLEYLLLDSKVKVIGVYLEEFADGYDFIKLKQKLKIEKPIVVLNPGRSSEAKAAMSSHTGALAGNNDIIDSALKENGILKVESIGELIDVLSLFNNSDLPNAGRIAIVTNAGGPGIIATDVVVGAGLEIAELSASTKGQLRENLPTSAAISNPIDVVGDALVTRYESVINVLKDAPEVDVIIVILTPQLVTQIEDTAKLLINLKKSTHKIIIPVFIGGRYVAAGLNRLADNKITAFTEIESAVKSLSALLQYRLFLSTPKKPEVQGIKRAHNLAKPKEAKVLPDAKAIELLENYGIDVVPTALVRNLEQAYVAAKKIKYPLVLKATSEQLLHRSDFQAVYVGIENDAELKQKLTKLQSKLYELFGSEYPAVLIQAMAKGSPSAEILLGVKRDGDSDVYSSGVGFGHLMLVGTGGIYTEIYGDVAKTLLPSSEKDLNSLVGQSKIGSILNGARGGRPFATAKLNQLIVNLQKLVLENPEITELDLNPVIVTRKDVFVVDVKILISA